MHLVKQRRSYGGLFIPTLGTFYSQAGNVLFPRWESFIGIGAVFSFNKERVLNDKGTLLKIKGRLLENKWFLLQDLTWFSEKVSALSDLPYGLTFEVHKRNRILFVFLNLCDFS